MNTPLHNIIPLCRNENEDEFLHQRFDVMIYREAGRATVQRALQQPETTVESTIQHLPVTHRPYENTRSITARRSFIDFAVANQLSRMFTLTYRIAPNAPGDALSTFDKFIRRLRRQHPQLVWLQVVQRGARNHRLHHHLLTTTNLDRQLIQHTWARGRIHLQDRNSFYGIRQQAGYLCKDFELPASERIGPRRYRRSRNGISPQPEHHYVTAAELDLLLADTAPDGYEKWYPPAGTPFHEWTAYWNPLI